MTYVITYPPGEKILQFYLFVRLIKIMALQVPYFVLVKLNKSKIFTNFINSIIFIEFKTFNYSD